jgi:hypothetical protein
MTIWRMRIACWVSEAPNTHSKYVTLIAFPLQQWLQELASVLRYTYIDCFLTTLNGNAFNMSPSCYNLLNSNNTLLITACEFHVV